MTLKERMGFDAGSTRVEDALDWAVRHDFHFVDFNADTGANRLDGWDAARVRIVRETCERHAMHLGLHTSSAVNVAEFAPYVADGVEQYLRANVDFATRLGCEWIVVHAGYHFSSAIPARVQASVERLKRLTAYAETHRAHLVPEGIDGFLDAFGVARIGEVRLADNQGEYEIHMNPGQGTIDFQAMFRRLESSGFGKHYTMAFGSLDDKLAARDWLAARGG